MRGAMKLTVLLFARAAELLGTRSLEVELPVGSTVEDLRRKLSQCPLNWAVAVNREYAEDSRVLLESEEIAIFPPVSGG